METILEITRFTLGCMLFIFISMDTLKFLLKWGYTVEFFNMLVTEYALDIFSMSVCVCIILFCHLHRINNLYIKRDITYTREYINVFGKCKNFSRVYT